MFLLLYTRMRLASDQVDPLFAKIFISLVAKMNSFGSNLAKVIVTIEFVSNHFKLNAY